MGSKMKTGSTWVAVYNPPPVWNYQKSLDNEQNNNGKQEQKQHPQKYSLPETKNCRTAWTN